MTPFHDEKRRASRIFFNNNEEIEASINGAGQSFFVDVLNLSRGGLQFSQKRQDSVAVQIGDKLSLVALSGLDGCDGIGHVTMEVRWVLDQDFFGVVSAGCKFLDMSDQHQELIQQVIDARVL